MEPACSSQGRLSSRQEPSCTRLPGNWTGWPGLSAVSRPPSTQPQARAQEPLCEFSSGQLCDPRDCSPPGSSVRGVSRQEYWSGAAISYSRAPSRPRGQTHVSWVSCLAGGVFTTTVSGKPLRSLAVGIRSLDPALHSWHCPHCRE